MLLILKDEVPVEDEDDVVVVRCASHSGGGVGSSGDHDEDGVPRVMVVPVVCTSF
jgi:hypothetical protein